MANPPAPRPWRRITLHQFTFNGHLPGVAGSVDLDRLPRVSNAGRFSAVWAYPARRLL